MKFDRRLSRGLLIGANYTWSATLGVGESDVRVQNATTGAPPSTCRIGS